MKTKPLAILAFDTSTVGAGAFLLSDTPEPRIPIYEEVQFGTSAGDEALTRLFLAAAGYQNNYRVLVAVERVCGYDSKAQSIRAGSNERIGVIRDWARRYDIRWGGDVAPSTAKLALAQSGNADNEKMLRWLKLRFNIVGVSDHIAAAVGVGLAALAGRYIMRKTGGRSLRRVAARVAVKQGRLTW